MEHPAKKKRYDYTLLIVVLLLVIIGLVLLYSTSAYNGRVKFHDSFYYLKKQGFATALGLVGMMIVAKIDYHKWVPLAGLGYLTAILLSVAGVQVSARLRSMLNMRHALHYKTDGYPQFFTFRTYPVPRTVWISFVSNFSSIFFLK